MKGTSPQLDNLIAKSKQVTADLMTARRDAARMMAGRLTEASVSNVRSRICLVLDEMHAMSDELHRIWMQSSPYKHREGPSTVIDAQLTNGHLQLTRGKKQ